MLQQADWDAASRRFLGRADLRGLPGNPNGARRDLRIYTLEERALDELTPLICNLGLRVFDQTQFGVRLGSHTHHIRSFVVEMTSAGDHDALGSRLKSALARLLAGEIENDSLNRLIGCDAFEWREIELLRAYCSYRLQLGASIGRDIDARFRPGEQEARLRRRGGFADRRLRGTLRRARRLACNSESARGDER